MNTQLNRSGRIVAALMLGILITAFAIVFWPQQGTAKLQPHDHDGHTRGSSTASPTDEPSGPPSEQGSQPTTPPAGPPPDKVRKLPAETGRNSKVGAAPESSLGDAASTDPGGRRNNSSLPGARGPVDPSDVLDQEAFGGCLVAYGDPGQCVSLYPPSLAPHVQEMIDAGLDPSTMPHDWTCEELLVYFADGVPVRQPGVDPQGLDPEADGVACGVPER